MLIHILKALTGIAALLGSATVDAQTTDKAARVAWVSVFPLAQVEAYLSAFKDGLAAQGYVEGRNLTLEAFSADGEPDRLPALIDALAKREPDVIVSQGAAIFSVRHVKTIPVVYGFSGDPVSANLTDSLARPSSNLTGVTFMSVDLNEKRLEMLREFAPSTKRVVLMGDPVHPGVNFEVEVSHAMAKRLGMEVRWAPTRNVKEVRDLLASLEGALPTRWSCCLTV
jgi:putative ABC transport system substrate-binding protein